MVGPRPPAYSLPSGCHHSPIRPRSPRILSQYGARSGRFRSRSVTPSPPGFVGFLSTYMITSASLWGQNTTGIHRHPRRCQYRGGRLTARFRRWQCCTLDSGPDTPGPAELPGPAIYPHRRTACPAKHPPHRAYKMESGPDVGDVLRLHAPHLTHRRIVQHGLAVFRCIQRHRRFGPGCHLLDVLQVFPTHHTIEAFISWAVLPNSG